jgi:hypothetical protein
LAQQFQRRLFSSDLLPNFLFLVTAAILVGGGIVGHNSERRPPQDQMSAITKNRKFSKKSLKNDL